MNAEESSPKEPLAEKVPGKVVLSASAVRHLIFSEQLREALMRWALVSMGRRRARDYIDAARFNFVTSIIAEIKRHPDADLVHLLRGTPFVVPRSARRVSAFKRDFDILAFLDAYQKTHHAVRAARGKLRRASLKVKEQAYQSILPGASPYDVTRYCSMTPQGVALDYVCWKLKVGRTGEALKKKLQRNLSPRRIKQLRDAARAEADAVEALASLFPARPSAPPASSDVPPSDEAPKKFNDLA